MELKEKIAILVDYLDKSSYVELNGNICCFCPYDTFEGNDKSNVTAIYFDDSTRDDHYNLINLDDVKDIVIVGGSFKLLKDNNKYDFITLYQKQNIDNVF